MLRLKEAIQIAKMNGTKTIQMDLAREMWPNAAPLSQKNQISNLLAKIKDNPKTKISVCWVDLICEKCEVTPNFLFGKETMEV